MTARAENDSMSSYNSTGFVSVAGHKDYIGELFISKRRLGRINSEESVGVTKQNTHLNKVATDAFKLFKWEFHFNWYFSTGPVAMALIST